MTGGMDLYGNTARGARLELGGMIPPVVLPLDRSEEIDEPGLRREIRLLTSAGIDALVVNGSTSEGAMLSPEEQEEVCRIAVDEVAGRMPVLSGVLADSTREAVELGHRSRRAGASALLLAPVLYLHLPPRPGTVEFFRTVGREVGLPIVLYNVAPLQNLSPDLCLELAELPEVVAIKQSNENFHELADLLAVAGDRIRVLSAMEDLLFPSLVLGAHGCLAAIIAVLPELCVALHRAFQQGDYATARTLHERILPVVRALLVEENYPATVKLALRLLGRPVGPARSPLTAPSAEVEATIRHALGMAGVLP